jgi:hypothetical protein
MPTAKELGTRLKVKARFLSLTAEIERLRSLGPDNPLREALGPKIDEAAELLERIALLD